jgi:hypothetical protein
MTGVEILGKLPQAIAAFKKEEDSYRLIDPATEPQWAGPGIQDLAVAIENTYEFMVPINTNQETIDRLIVIRDATNNAYDALRDAIPPAAPAGPGGAQAWTQQHVINKQAEVAAQRAAAMLNAELKTDDIRMAAEAREATRRRGLKTFEERQTACLGVFHSIISPEMLQPYMNQLANRRFRQVFRDLIAAHDGTRAGIDNRMAVISELSAYIYSSDVSMGDNIQYIEILSGIAGFDDSQKLVVLLTGLERCPSVHPELKHTAGLHRRLNSDYTTVSTALVKAYAVLLNTGKITQDPAGKKPQTAERSAASFDTEKLLKQRIKDLEENRQGRQARKRAAALNLNTGPGRGPKKQKGDAKADVRHCKTCHKDGHDTADCWINNPCSRCGSTTHGDWGHDRAVAKEEKRAAGAGGGSQGSSTGMGSLSDQFTNVH